MTLHVGCAAGRIEEFMEHIQELKKQNSQWRERSEHYRNKCKVFKAKEKYCEQETESLKHLLHKVYQRNLC